MTTVTFNPFAPGYAEDPYPHFAALREHDPVHETPLGTVVLTRYDDVLALLRDPELSADMANASPNELMRIRDEALGPEAFDERQQSMLDLDPPDHTRLRKLVSRAFTPRRIADLRPRIEALVRDRVTTARDAGGFEAIGDLAFPLPFEVISEMLGMPTADSARIRDISGTLVRTLEPVVDPDVLQAIRAAGMQMLDHINGAISWKRENPADDLLTLLIDAEEDGDSLTDAELVAQVSLLFVAGHETTVNLIGNGLLALARSPDAQRLLASEPDRIENAVEEMLRYDAPVQMTRRITRAPYEVGAKTIPAGTFVMGTLASANRDHAKFGTDADEFDIGRTDAREHVAFGGGIHFCLGAALARLEAQIAIGVVVEELGAIELAGDPVYNGRINLRGLDQLPLRAR